MARKIISPQVFTDFLLLFSMCFSFKSTVRRWGFTVTGKKSFRFYPSSIPSDRRAGVVTGVPSVCPVLLTHPKPLFGKRPRKRNRKQQFAPPRLQVRLHFRRDGLVFFVRTENYKCRTPRGGADGSRRSGFAEKTHFRFYKAYLLTSSCPR